MTTLNKGPINYGKQFNYFKKLTVTWSTFGSDGYHCDIVIPFSTQGVIFLNEDTSDIVEVSFDGTNIHDELNPAQPSKGVVYDNRDICKVWFRLSSGSSAVVTIRAWGIR